MPHPQREDIQRAFRLAGFILGDRRAARRATLEAVARLEVSARAQRKRRYYRPIGRAEHRAPARNKVTASERNLLQRLVYVTSEPFEREQEDRVTHGAATGGPPGKGPSDRDMIVRFVKELVRVTVKRNAFYVSLGIVRLLHDYPTTAAIELHGLLADDPDRTPDDTYWRARRLALVRELADRFQAFARVVTSSRGEKRFASRQPDPEIDALVRRCLDRFTPWDSVCALPPGFAPHRDVIPTFHTPSADPDEGHSMEMDRIHALLHSPCFATLTSALGFDRPAERLTVPLFAVAAEPPQAGPEIAPLDPGELRALDRDLAARKRLRRRLAGAAFSIRVDGEERATLENRAGAHCRFELGEADELVEVIGRSERGEVVVGALMPSLTPPAVPHAVRLSYGLTLDLVVRPAGEGRLLDVSCRQSGWAERFAAMAAGRGGETGTRWRHVLRHPAWRPAIAALAVTAGLGLAFQLRSPAGSSPPEAVPPDRAVSTTRSPLAPPPVLRAASVDRVWVPVLAPNLGGPVLRRSLERAMAEWVGLTVVQDPEQAEAALKPLLGAADGDEIGLVNADGTVLWRTPYPTGDPERAARLVADALARYRQSPSSTNPAQK